MTQATLAPSIIRFDIGNNQGERDFLIDAAGKLVREPDLLDVRPFVADGRGGFIAAACDGNKLWGYIDQDGKWLTPPQFDDARSHGTDGMARVKQNDLWGYVNARGEVTITPQFQGADPFAFGLAGAARKEKWGFINADGIWVIAEQFTGVQPFSAAGLARIYAKKRFGFIDRTGAVVIPARFQEARAFSDDGVAPVSEDGKKCGLIDVIGNWVLKPCYPEIHTFNSFGLAFFDAREPAQMSYESEGRGFLNAKGEVVIKGYDWLSPNMSAGLARLPDGFYDNTGTLAFTISSGWTGGFTEQGVMLAEVDDKWGLLNTKGKFTPCKHHEPWFDRDSHIIGFRAGAYVPFVTHDRTIVYVNQAGEDCLRLAQVAAPGAQYVLTLSNMRGEVIWQGAPSPQTTLSTAAQLNREPREHFTDLDYWQGDIVEHAKKLIEEPPQEFFPYSLIFDDQERTVYELSQLREDDEDFDESCLHQGAMLVLATSYFNDTLAGNFEWVNEVEDAKFQSYFDALKERLTKHFGKPLPDGKANDLRPGDYGKLCAWKVDKRRLVLQKFVQTGDGDLELQLWLAVVAGS